MPRRAPDPLRPFHPIVRAWFLETLGAPSEPQRRGWPAIASGEHILLLAPTGTGKTLAAFLWELNRLITEGRAGPLPNAVQLLYVSPLKALNNDIQRNLERPLRELRARFEAAGELFPEIRVAVRTGDTPAAARARMLRTSPHILITTPESLNIMLTTERGRGMFGAVRAVILDEIHAVAGSKRGAHLALTLERLQHLTEHAPQRIGLSATQRPLEEVARFLGGCVVGTGDRGLGTGQHTERHSSGAVQPPVPSPQSPHFRPVTIIDCGLVKQMELRVVSPVADLGEVGGTVWPKVVDVVHQHVRQVRTTLVFVNNRAQAERIAARLNAQAEEELAQPYHGSLARERRHALEAALKAGELRVLVATSSLELGIDIGSVDLVIQLQSPKRVAAGLQRVGRAGHTLGAVSRGIFVPTFRDDLVEIAAIVGAMRAGEVESTRVPQNALDVLAQAVVAAVSVDDWAAGELFDLVRGAYPYHRLTRGAFDEVLAALSGKYPSDLAAELEPRITWDRVADRLTGSRRSRMMAVISGGTIPDRGLYTVHLADRTRLGELDEEFVHESRVGDVFQLGSSTWRIAAIEHDRVVVHPAPGAPARMPFWHGEYMARSVELGQRVGDLRRAFAGTGNRERGTGAPSELPVPRSRFPVPVERLAEQYGLDAMSVHSLQSYIAEQRTATGVVPDERTLVVEQFRDELGAVRIVVHSVFGGRVNAPWGMALAQRVKEEMGVDVQVQTTDDGIMLRLPDLGARPPVRALTRLSPDEAERRVLAEVGTSSLFGARFRMNAARALLLPRDNPRRRMPLWLQRLKALDLLDTVRAFPTFPILVETYREILQDAFDLEALKRVLADVEAGRIAVRVVETERPSPFAASLQFGFVVDWLYADDTPRAERKAALLSVDRGLLDEVMGAEGADEDMRRTLDEVLAERRGTAPGFRARGADELAHLLDRAGDLTVRELRDRVAEPARWRRGDPIAELLDSARALAIRLPAAASVAPAAPGGIVGPGEAAATRALSDGAGGPPRTAVSHRTDTGSASFDGEAAHPVAEAPPGGESTAIPPRGPHLDDAWRIILVESYPRYAAAYPGELGPRVRVGSDLAERDAAEVIPAALHVALPSRAHGADGSDASDGVAEGAASGGASIADPPGPGDARAQPAAGWMVALEPRVARREILARWLALAGPVTAEELRARYGWSARWLESRCTEWERTGRLVRGRFRRGVTAPEWCSRKVVEIARRRALAALRKQIEATDLATFAAFLQRWQHVDPRDRLDGVAGLEAVLRQLEGVPRPAAGWERDYLPARLHRYDPAWLSQLGASGRLVWAGAGVHDRKSGTIALSSVRFFERGAGALWLPPDPAASLPLSDATLAVRAALERYGASFLADVQAAAGLGALALKDALRELVAAGLATNDTVEALREVIRMRPLPDRPRAGGPDPTRWLPSDFTPSPNRYVVQRRPNLRRLPKWRRPDLGPAVSEWSGRWSLLRPPGAAGERTLPEEEHGAAVARQWLERYGVVTRDWWKRERPPVSWRAIYRELGRMEYRGEVRRGYFVRGLAGAQFAPPEAVERLRAEGAAEGSGERDGERGAAHGGEPVPFVVMAAGDPANPYVIAPDPVADQGIARDPLSRPRGAGALLVTRAGRVAIAAEGRGRRLMLADWLSPDEVTAAARVLAVYLDTSPAVGRRKRELVVETIGGTPATASSHLDAFRRAGYRLATNGLVWLADRGSRPAGAS